MYHNLAGKKKVFINYITTVSINYTKTCGCTEFDRGTSLADSKRQLNIRTAA
jgi:hypothetical protein